METRYGLKADLPVPCDTAPAMGLVGHPTTVDVAKEADAKLGSALARLEQGASVP